MRLPTNHPLRLLPGTIITGRLSEALNLQLQSDSLARIVRDKRVLAKETPDNAMKKQLVNDIIRMDKEAKRLQREADQKFAEAKKLNDEANKLSPPDTISPLVAPVDSTAAGAESDFTAGKKG